MTTSRESWRPVKLKYLVSLRAGGTPKVDELSFWAEPPEGTPWVSIGDMTAQPVIGTTQRHVSDRGLRAARLAVGEAGTLLFAMYASVGATAVLGTPAAWNQAILGLTAKPETHLPFVHWALRAMRPRLSHITRSNTQENLNAHQVANLTIPCPEPTEQQLVARFLDRESARIDDLLAELHEFEATLRLQEQQVASRAFRDLPTVPLRYRLERIEQGWSPECEARLAEPGEWGVLKVGCVNYGRFRPLEHKRLPDELTPKGVSEVAHGDLLVSRANTRDLVGSAAVVDDTAGRRLMLSDKLYRLVLTRGMRSGLVAAALNSRAVRDQIEIATSGASSSMQNISQDVIRSLRIPDCALEEQDRRLERLTDARNKLRSAETEIAVLQEELREYRNALALEAVSGQLDVGALSEAQMTESLAAIREGEKPEVLA